MQGDRARSALIGTRFADLRWEAETGSTNADVMELARGGAPEGVVVVADHQSAGRGRLGRVWEAPAGGSLLFSVLLRPQLQVGDAHLVTSAMGVAVAEACRQVADAHPLIKWPNDLVIVGGTVFDHRKVAGILAESLVSGTTLEALVVGVGLNVNWPVDLRPELTDIAVALNRVVGHHVDRQDLLAAVLQHFEVLYGHLLEPDGVGRKVVMDRARELSATLDCRVTVDLGAETVVGTAVDLTDDGYLEVLPDDGSPKRRVVVGDVVQLRPLD